MDDMTYCYEDCKIYNCLRNKRNIHNPNVLHSWAMKETFPECPYNKKELNMIYVNDSFAEQGWQCPICKRVYSPLTSMCSYCGNSETYTTSSYTCTTKSNSTGPFTSKSKLIEKLKEVLPEEINITYATVTWFDETGTYHWDTDCDKIT